MCPLLVPQPRHRCCNSVGGNSTFWGHPTPSGHCPPPLVPIHQAFVCPASPSNCARQPLLGLPAEQDRPFSLPSSGTDRVAEQRALSEHHQVPDGPCHFTSFHFGPEMASEIRHVSETQPMSLASTHFLVETFLRPCPMINKVVIQRLGLWVSRSSE